MNEVIRTLENEVFKRYNSEFRKDIILKKYFHNSKNKIGEKILLLWPFVQKTPFKYINGEVYEIFSDFITKNKPEFKKSILKYNNKLTKAILAFRNTNSELFKENPVTDLSPENIFKFDTVYHPEYTRNIESIYGHLIDIIIDTLDQITPDKTYSIDTKLANKMQILKSNKLGIISNCCDTFIRNSVSHGNFYYEMEKIIYADKKKVRVLYPNQFIEMLDNLQNTIASILLCIMLLVIDDEEEDSILSSSEIPLGIIFLYLSGLLEHHSLEYLYIVENKIIENRKQVIFEIKAESKSRNWLTIECFKLAYHLNNRFNHKYDRLGVHIDSNDSVKSSMFINLANLNENIESGNFNNLNKSLENSLLWHDEKIYISRLRTWRNILYYSKHNFIKTFNEKFYSEMDWINYKDYFIIKHIEDRSSVNLGRILIHIVVIKEIQFLLDDVESFIDFLLYIVKINRKPMKLKIFGINDRTKRVKPVYIWGKLYKQDLRIRNLDNKNNRICDFEWIHKSKKDVPILLKKTQNTKGIRIKFNG